MLNQHNGEVMRCPTCVELPLFIEYDSEIGVLKLFCDNCNFTHPHKHVDYEELGGES